MSDFLGHISSHRDDEIEHVRSLRVQFLTPMSAKHLLRKRTLTTILCINGLYLFTYQRKLSQTPTYPILCGKPNLKKTPTLHQLVLITTAIALYNRSHRLFNLQLETCTRHWLRRVRHIRRHRRING